MGWLQLVGSLKLQVSFAKETYKKDLFFKETYTFDEPTNRSHPICKMRHPMGLRHPARFTSYK